RPVGNGRASPAAASGRRGPATARNSWDRGFPPPAGLRGPRANGAPEEEGALAGAPSRDTGRDAAAAASGGALGRGARASAGRATSGRSPVGRLVVGTAPVTRGRATE